MFWFGIFYVVWKCSYHTAVIRRISVASEATVVLVMRRLCDLVQLIVLVLWSDKAVSWSCGVAICPFFTFRNSISFCFGSLLLILLYCLLCTPLLIGCLVSLKLAVESHCYMVRLWTQAKFSFCRIKCINCGIIRPIKRAFQLHALRLMEFPGNPFILIALLLHLQRWESSMGIFFSRFTFWLP